jgi:NAD-dependent deacetylase
MMINYKVHCDGNVPVLDPCDYDLIVFFTGAGMSAESGIPTYRGAGGIWHEYNWQEYACQKAFEQNPDKVLEFHELRRSAVLECQPNSGHAIISQLQTHHKNTWIVTQNIDGMHQRAGSNNIVELHGSLWHLRCPEHGIHEDLEAHYKTRKCPDCTRWLRPDVTWFEDILDINIMEKTRQLVTNADLFICIGTSGVVFPAAAFPVLAHQSGAYTICVNAEIPEHAAIYDLVVIGKASDILEQMFRSKLN